MKDVLREVGVANKNNFGSLLKEFSVATKKDLEKFMTKRDLNKVKKELIMAIGNVAPS